MMKKEKKTMETERVDQDKYYIAIIRNEQFKRSIYK
jgi:hypothetical protein